MRTCEGLGAHKLYITGYSPYPLMENDARLPHLARKISQQISKTSLGAESSLTWEYNETINPIIESLREKGYSIVALEQTSQSIPLQEYKAPQMTALILGEEVNGIESSILSLCDESIEIPMFGSKESFNVSVAAGIALYHLRFSGSSVV